MNTSEIFYILSRLEVEDALDTPRIKEFKDKAIAYFKEAIKARCCGSCRSYTLRAMNGDYPRECCAFLNATYKETSREKTCPDWEILSNEESRS